MSELFKVDDKRQIDKEGNLKEDAKSVEQSTQEVGKNPEQKDEPKALTMVEEIVSGDLIAPMVKAGKIPGTYIIDGATGKIVDSPIRFPLVDPPWIYTNNDWNRNCGWLRDLFEAYHFIPRKCMNCWKVVVIPRTFKELMELYRIQAAMAKQNPYCWSKCGLELRDQATRKYGGYFYNNSKAEGLNKLDQVRAAVYKYISPDVPVFLKRSCSEFEWEFGDTPNWDTTIKQPWWEPLEDAINEISAVTPAGYHQPEIIKRHVIATWITYAEGIGDKTVRDMNNGKGLYTEYSKYEREDHGKQAQKCSKEDCAACTQGC